MNLLTNPFYLIFGKILWVFAIMGLARVIQQPIVCAVIYTGGFAISNFLMAGVLGLQYWQVAAYTVMLAAWSVFLFRLLDRTESETDNLIYSIFGGYVLFAF